METLDLTRGRLLRVWWSLTWRGIAIAFACGIVLDTLIIPLTYAVGAGRDTLLFLNYAIGFSLWLPATFVAVWSVFHKRFKEFRLVLVAREAGEGEG